MKFIDKLSEALEQPDLPGGDEWLAGSPPHTYLKIQARNGEGDLNEAAAAASDAIAKYGFINFNNISSRPGFLASGSGVAYPDLVEALDRDNRFENISDKMRIAGKLSRGSAFKFIYNEIEVEIILQPRINPVQFGQY